MLLFWPRVLVIGDEERYVTQALAFSRGALTMPGSAILYPPTKVAVVSDFPPGTSLLQVPFVWIAGWRGAVLLSLLSLIATTLITRRWLVELGLEPAFSILIPAFFGAMFFGRVAMSDVPSAAAIALSLWALWRAEGGKGNWSFLAGVCSGLTLLFREPNAVLLAPLLIEAMVRRRCAVMPLIAGGALGIAVRLALSTLFFGAPFYVRDSGYGFSLGSLTHSALPFAIILLVMFPLGGVLPFFYRGPRRGAVQWSLALYSLLFLLYEYDSISENGGLKGLILASRYMVPALPLFTLVAADVLPRWYRGLIAPPGWPARALVIAAAAGVAVVAFAVHPAASRQEKGPLAIVRAIYGNTSADIPVITNNKATLKYLSASYGPRRLILRADADSAHILHFQRAYRALSLVLLDRDDSEMFRQDALDNERFLERLRRQCSLRTRYDVQHSGSMRLRIFDVRQCS